MGWLRLPTLASLRRGPMGWLWLAPLASLGRGCAGWLRLSRVLACAGLRRGEGWLLPPAPGGEEVGLAVAALASSP